MAELQGANLWRAKLQGANLSEAKLQGANLARAQLQGADLSEAKLQGADLSEAKLQGAMIYNTGIVGIINPPSASVFSVFEVQNMFDDTLPVWAELETIDREIQNTKFREPYLARISHAKNNPSVDAKRNWKHSPLTIAEKALPNVCGYSLESTKAFRSSYQNMNPQIQERKEERLVIIKDIDKKICTLEECKTLRDSIDGLDCKAK